jgi:FG-GAP-like repeat
VGGDSRRPIDIAVGDFNEDGRQDLATANSGHGADGVSILIGKGDGTFAPATHVRWAKPDEFAIPKPFSIASGDFNRDGHVDLATANFGTVTVGILLGRGDGTFSRQPDLPVPFNNGNLVGVAVADFNGDARQDLAVSDHYFNDVLIFLGRGNGTFREGRRFDVGARPTNIAVGDFNEDGRRDLATANDIDSQQQVSLLFGRGDGTFQPVRYVRLNPQIEGAAPQAIAITVGDFNGDCHQDLATARTNAVLLGDGSGNFEHVQSIEAGADPTLLAAGRFNRDRASDLAIPNADDFPGTVSVALSTGAVGCS